MAFVLTWSIIGIFPLIMTMIKTDWTDCPHICRCKWISGKKSAICTDSSLATLPANLSIEIQVLNISNNLLVELREDAFRSVGLINLQRICLKRTRLEYIHENAFRDLIILIEIDLSENKLSNIHPHTFYGNERLRILNLNMNPLIRLQASQFPILPHLRTLELEQCQLKSIHSNAFINLYQLDYLNLKRNKLTTLSDNVIKPLIHLMTLILNDNPWICDCHLKRFRNWFLAKKFQTQTLSCQQPLQYINITWDTDIAFVCKPEVSTLKTLIRTEIGSNLTIECEIFGDPEPEVTWLFNSELLMADNIFKTFITFERINFTNKWFNLTILNITQNDIGEYSCYAKSQYGISVKNITVILPIIVATATTFDNRESIFFWIIYTSCGVGVLSLILLIIASLYAFKKRKKNCKNTKPSVSFTDQNKMLLIESNCASNNSLVEKLSERNEIIDRKQSPTLLNDHHYHEHPLHITIENNLQHKSTTVVLPPPPEFSSNKSITTVTTTTTITTTTTAPINNIFISVTIPTTTSIYPNQDSSYQYPDLLDKTPYKPIPIIASSTLPRLSSSKTDPLPLLSTTNCFYDNMGPRITANGSSLILNETHDYFNDKILVHSFPKQMLYKPQCVFKNSDSTKLEYVTL